MRARSTLLLAYALAAAACTSTSYGDGIGRPAYPATRRPARLPLSIVEVYVADDDPAKRFAVVTNGGGATSTPLTLRGPAGDVPLGSAVPAGIPEAPGELRVSLASLGQPGKTLLGGELAVVDDADTVHAYLAWVSDPNAVGSTLAGEAFASGATTIGTFVHGGFPIPSGLAFVATLAGSGCAAPSDTAAGIGPVSACPVTPGALLIDAALPALAPGAPSWVRVRNTTAADLDLFGVQVCNAQGCAAVIRDQVVAAGAAFELPLVAPPPADALLPGAEPLAAADEVALRAPGSTSLDPDPMLQSYVRYGASDGHYVDAAVAAGLWPSTSTSDSALAPRRGGEIVAHATDGALAVPFVPAHDDADVASLPLGPTADLWTTCSYARPWRASPEAVVALTRIDRAPGGAADRLTITNRGAVEVDLAGYTLDVAAPGGSGTTAVTLPLDAIGLLAPGAAKIVELRAPADDCAPNVCLAGATLGDTTELALRSAGTLVQYVAFGPGARTYAGADARAYAAEAVAANLWPGATLTRDATTTTWECSVPSVAAGAWVILDPTVTTAGSSPADWD